MLPFVESLVRQITLTTLLDIAITALFIYWLFSLIRGTRAVTLVIGVSMLLGVYALAQFLQLRLFTQLLQAGAVVGAFALVVVFQPELRRGLERIGRVGTLSWLLAPSEQRRIEHVAAEVSKAAGILSRQGHGALIVLERETGLEEIAESGVMLHANLSHELLTTIFAPRTELHDGAVIVRGDGILAAAALLPLTEMTLSERFGTRHRAALGITEDTDAVAVVVSEENGQMSVVERARIVRVPTEAQLERALTALLETPSAAGGLRRGTAGRAGARLRIARRRARRDEQQALTAASGAGTTTPATTPTTTTTPATTTPAGAAPSGTASPEPATRAPAGTGTQPAPASASPEAAAAPGTTAAPATSAQPGTTAAPATSAPRATTATTAGGTASGSPSTDQPAAPRDAPTGDGPGPGSHEAPRSEISAGIADLTSPAHDLAASPSDPAADLRIPDGVPGDEDEDAPAAVNQ